MKARMKPILFSTSDVQAILDGRKTMKRMVVKQSVVDRFVIGEHGELLGSFDGESDAYPTIDDAPYQTGDILYVRETWAKTGCDCDFIDDNDMGKHLYRATDDLVGGAVSRWRSPATMPRAAARIFLRVIEVRVERLQDISRSEAILEGFRNEDDWGAEIYFEETWNNRYAKRRFGWDKNPWVWATLFERCEKPQEDVNV